jgi:hypothetical protein
MAKLKSKAEKEAEKDAKAAAKEGEKTPARLSSDEEKKVAKPTGEDYLRAYQYKTVNNRPQLGGVLTDPDKGSKAEIMKASLLKQPRVSIMIPLDPGSSPKVPYSVTFNGYRLDFPVQQYIDVPEQVAEKIRSANNQTIAALNRDRIDGDSAKETALS